MMRNMLHKMLLTGFAVLAAVLLTPGAAHAQATLTAGNTPQAGEENVLLNTGDTGTTVLGVTQQSGFHVAFHSNSPLEGALTAPANGQARVEAVDGTLNNVDISVVDGSFKSLIFNPFTGTGNLTVDVTYLVNNVAGTQSFNVALGNGNNFQTLTIAPVNSQTYFTKVTLTAAGPDNGFTDLRQVRIVGATSTDPPIPQALVPEPASIAMALPGLFPMGLMFLRRRKKARSA